ncbi:MAG: hypothetical protein NT123_24205 [Proteobacteria bacterium]|nr:hypothetical protein [Pseudomonadota bacterium]
MSILQSLKVITAKRPNHASPITQRRNVLLKKIHEQIEAAKARAEGKQYSVKDTRRISNRQTGEQTEIIKDRYIREGWWIGDEGRLLLELRYGMKPLEFGKGKSTIDIGDWENLIPTLEKLQQAVQLGEFDDQLNVTATMLGQQLAKKKKTSK